MVACLAALGLTGCQGMTQHETAQHALQVFCSLHKSEIFATLLTPQQQQAGTIVCQAIGQPLGTPD